MTGARAYSSHTSTALAFAARDVQPLTISTGMAMGAGEDEAAAIAVDGGSWCDEEAIRRGGQLESGHDTPAMRPAVVPAPQLQVGLLLHGQILAVPDRLALPPADPDLPRLGTHGPACSPADRIRVLQAVRWCDDRLEERSRRPGPRLARGRRARGESGGVQGAGVLRADPGDTLKLRRDLLGHGARVVHRRTAEADHPPLPLVHREPGRPPGRRTARTAGR